jgi:hypothetical protein
MAPLLCNIIPRSRRNIWESLDEEVDEDGLPLFPSSAKPTRPTQLKKMPSKNLRMSLTISSKRKERLETATREKEEEEAREEMTGWNILDEDNVDTNGWKTLKDDELPEVAEKVEPILQWTPANGISYTYSI